jgi:hypothetical protein
MPGKAGAGPPEDLSPITPPTIQSPPPAITTKTPNESEISTHPVTRASFKNARAAGLETPALLATCKAASSSTCCLAVTASHKGTPPATSPATIAATAIAFLVPIALPMSRATP